MSNPIRLPGLASGLDVEALIKTYMTAERRPVALLEQRQTALVSKANAWRDLNTRLNTLSKRASELKILTTGDWNARKAVSTDGTVATASATSAAVPGSYSLEVVKLAKAAVWQSATTIADANTDLGHSGDLVVSGGAGNGQKLTVAATDSLNEIAAKINADKGRLGFSAAVLQVNPGDYRLILTGQNGTANGFTLTDDGTTTVATDLGLTSATATQVETAGNAEFKVNGTTVTAGDNKADGVIPGVTVNLNKVGTATITVTKDATGVAGAVKSLVDQYNQVMDFIGQNTSYNQDTKKAGTLFGEGMISSISSTVTSLVTGIVNGQPDGFAALSNIGITREKYNPDSSKGLGKLEVDMAKLTKAIETNSDSVKRLFVNDTGPDKGIAVRMSNWMDGYIAADGLLSQASDNLDDQVEDIKDRVKKFDEVTLPHREQRLRAQFTALERVMSAMDSQGKWLSSQLKAMEPMKK